MILLQVGSVEPRVHELTFHGHFQGPNVDQYQRKNHQNKVILVTIDI
jgi:hypothetical protein